MDSVKIVLEDTDIPQQWYNIQADFHGGNARGAHAGVGRFADSVTPREKEKIYNGTAT